LKLVDPIDKQDEMSGLVESFRNMIQQLHDREVRKRSLSKYPANKFFNMAPGTLPWANSALLPVLLNEAKAVTADLPDEIVRVMNGTPVVETKVIPFSHPL
jgi:hypothetical protein